MLRLSGVNAALEIKEGSPLGAPDEPHLGGQDLPSAEDELAQIQSRRHQEDCVL